MNSEQKSKTEELLEKYNFPIPLREGWKLYQNSRYFTVYNCEDYPIASRGGRMPYHRFVLFETLGKPPYVTCQWCGYVLAWTTNLSHASNLVVNADHLDGDTFNNSPNNLVPSCSWCNKNRNWAQLYSDFWRHWRKWMKDVPPAMRPNLPEIAKDLGIDASEYYKKFRKEEEE